MCQLLQETIHFWQDPEEKVGRAVLRDRSSPENHQVRDKENVKN